MSDIKESWRDVPLLEVIEHIAGDPGQAVLQFKDITLQEATGRPSLADIGYEHVRAWWGDWEAVMPSDDNAVRSWDHALVDLIGAVRRADLRAKGRRPGSLFLEPISPGDFAELANNPIADTAPTVWCEGKLVLEFEDTKAIIVKCHSTGAPEVMWTDVCAESGAEVLGLWPSQSPDTNGTEDKGLVEVKPPPLGDAEPSEVGTNDKATTPTKAPSRKVLGVARELKKQYPDGLPTKKFKDLGRDLKVSDSTIKRAFSLNQWSRVRAK